MTYKVVKGLETKDIAARLAYLRNKRGVSARDMSLSIGQNVGYINNIENEKTTPSMNGLIYICEYFGITPSEFFDFDNQNPEKLHDLISDLKKLDDNQLQSVQSIVKEFLKK